MVLLTPGSGRAGNTGCCHTRTGYTGGRGSGNSGANRGTRWACSIANGTRPTEAGSRGGCGNHGVSIERSHAHNAPARYATCIRCHVRKGNGFRHLQARGAGVAPHNPSGERPCAEPARRPTRRVRVGEGVYQRIASKTGKPVPDKFEFTYRDATRHQIWQTATGTTKADAKAERAEILARIRLGQRVERTRLTVGAVARQWLDRGPGHQGRGDPRTRERYDRIVRRCIETSPEPTQRPLGDVKLRDLAVDRVAAWSQANEQRLAPTTATLSLITLNQPTAMRCVAAGWPTTRSVASNAANGPAGHPSGRDPRRHRPRPPARTRR